MYSVVMVRKASVWKRRDGRGTGWNTLALCVGYNIFCHLSFIVVVYLPIVPNEIVFYSSFLHKYKKNVMKLILRDILYMAEGNDE